MKKHDLVVFIIGIGLLASFLPASAASENLAGLLPKIAEQGVLLDRETFQTIRQADQHDHAGIIITNLKPRSTMQNLPLIQGTAPVKNQAVNATIITDSRRAVSLGSAEVNDRGEFSIVVTESLDSIQGEVLLVLSQIPNLQLSAILPKEMLVFPMTIDHGASVEESAEQQELGFYISEFTAWEGNKKVTALPGDQLTLYRDFPEEPLTLYLNGQIFHGQANAAVELSTMVIPTLEQVITPITVEADGQFQAELNLQNAKAGQTLQVIAQIKERGAPSRESSPLVRSFAIATQAELPSVLKTIATAFNDQGLNLVLMILIVILSIMIVKTLPKKYADARRVGIVLIAFEIGFLVWSQGGRLVHEINRTDILFPEEKTPFTIGRRYPEPPAIVSLTKLDDNLELEAGIASSWSQITPTQWEFVIRENTMTAEDAVSRLLSLQSSDQPEKKYLATVSEIRAVKEESVEKGIKAEENCFSKSFVQAPRAAKHVERAWREGPREKQFSCAFVPSRFIQQSLEKETPARNHITMVTRAPDPLLPKKLSRVDLGNDRFVRTSGAETYQIFQTTPRERLKKRNPLSFELPFLSDMPLYEKVLIEDDRDVVKRLIEERSVDLFDEPEVGVWPALSKNGYTIVPKLNTEIVVLLTNRESFFLKNANLISALRKILQSTRVLQTSYFQYGKLGTQFAPPGVVGYVSGMKLPEEQREPSAIFEEVKTALASDAITLKLHFPEEEKKLALVIEGELEREGLNIIPVEVPRQKFEATLLTKLPDLILLPLNFELGDVSPFLDAFIDSKSPFNNGYHNEAVDELIGKARTELNAFKRLKILREIMQIITIDDPAGVPILFKKSFAGRKNN